MFEPGITAEFLKLLFKEDEHVNICYYSPKESKRVMPRYLAETVTDGKYFCINPLKEDSSRKQLNLTERRNFLIEFDDSTIEEQEKFISDLKIPFKTVVFSGNKSLHVIISLKHGINKEYYRSITSRMRRALPMADPCCFEPARLSRLATDEQPLLKVGYDIDIEALEAWLTELGFPEEVHEQDPEECTKRDTSGILNRTTLLLLQNKIPKSQAHRAVISAAKNLQELGWTREETVNILASARNHGLEDETLDESKIKTEKVVNWVFDKWVTDAQ